MPTRWSVRLRDRDLTLLDEVRFSTLTLVRTYNAPSTLAITGRLDDIRRLLQPGCGVVVRNSDGQQFSGRLVSARRQGDGTGTALYRGDLGSLWDRVCYANTNLPWDGQISDRDVVTGTVEDRILSLVNRNAGPGAWHSDITGTDPGESTTFTPWKTIVPDVRTQVVQTVTSDPVTGHLYMTQIAQTGLVIRHLDANGVNLDNIFLPKGGRGEVLYLSSSGTGSKRRVYLTFRYGSTSLGNDRSGTWIRLPYTAGKTWTATAALAYKVRAPVASTRDRRDWCQGETTYGGYTFRLYGTPYTNTGSTVTPAIPAFVEVIRNNKILRTVPAGHLGRDAANNPYDGRLEPAGLSVASVGGQPSLIVGICTGTVTGGGVGNTGLIAQRLYSLPLKPAPRAAEDRRVPTLTMPTTQGRGAGGTTTARHDILGPLVASLAETASLSISIDQAPDGPYLQFSIADTPDLSDTIRVGQGGPVQIGDEWAYTDALATFTTGLSAAGGTGSERILRYQTDGITEDVWDTRVESFLDNSGLTDLSEIDDTIVKALADAAGPSEVSAPLGRTNLRWGIDIPLGAKISAVLDGEPVVERVRQITTIVANTSGTATTTETAVLGSPDAGLRIPGQRQQVAMLRRIQNLEKG